MKRWVSGHSLIKEHYGDNETEFFKEIEAGSLIPYRSDFVKEGYEGHRILPLDCTPLLNKIDRMLFLADYLDKTDEEYLRGRFRHRVGGNFEEDIDRLMIEEGPKELQELSEFRPKAEEEYKQLLQDIGDPDEALSPLKIWQCVTLSNNEQERLKEASYLIETDSQALGHEPLNIKQKKSDENYFKLKGDYWEVRFNGGKEILIKQSVNILTLTEYLKNPGKYIDKIGLRTMFNSEFCQENDFEKEKFNSNYQYNEKSEPLIDEKTADSIIDEIDDLRSRIELNENKGDIEQVELLKEEEKKYIKYLKNAGYYYDNDKKNFKKIASATFKNDSTKISGLISKQLQRSIDKIRGSGMTELASHLESYLSIKESVYRPPSDFTGWHISP